MTFISICVNNLYLNKYTMDTVWKQDRNHQNENVSDFLLDISYQII